MATWTSLFRCARRSPLGSARGGLAAALLCSLWGAACTSGDTPPIGASGGSIRTGGSDQPSWFGTGGSAGNGGSAGGGGHGAGALETTIGGDSSGSPGQGGQGGGATTSSPQGGSGGAAGGSGSGDSSAGGSGAGSNMGSGGSGSGDSSAGGSGAGSNMGSGGSGSGDSSAGGNMGSGGSGSGDSSAGGNTGSGGSGSGDSSAGGSGAGGNMGSGGSGSGSNTGSGGSGSGDSSAGGSGAGGNRATGGSGSGDSGAGGSGSGGAGGSGSGGSGSGGSGSAPSVGSCVQTCTTPADCTTPSAPLVFDENHYVCDAGVCAYLGCQDDNECFQTYGAGVSCLPSDDSPISECTAPCTSAADCGIPGGPALLDANHHECVAGVCKFLGCTSSSECIPVYGPTSVCGYAIGATVKTCLESCTVPLSCTSTQAPAVIDEDNYLCVDGGCNYLGCLTDQECADSYGTNWVCR